MTPEDVRTIVILLALADLCLGAIVVLLGHLYDACMTELRRRAK